MPVVHKVTADTVGGEPRDTAAVVDETPQTQPELAVAELTLLGDGRAGVNDGMSVFDRTPPRTALTDGLGGVNRSGDGMSVLEQTPHTAVSDGSDIGTSSRERFSQDLPVRSPQSRARCLF